MEPANKNYFLFFILIVVALEATLFFAADFKSDQAFKEAELQVQNTQNFLASLPLEAKAVSVYDFTSNRKIYGRNDDIPMPIASLTKIMTVIVALNNYDMSDIVSTSSDALKQREDHGLFLSERFKVLDLAKLTLVGSLNDGAYALLENVPSALEEMNVKAKKIGMEHALFLNPTGLDIDEEQAGVYASAADINIMTLYALRAYPEIFSASALPEINIKSESGFDHRVKNTNIILGKIPNILFSKTGLTPLAGGNLAVIYKNKDGHEIAITVLGSTEEGRFSDMEKIISALYNLSNM